MVSLSKTSVSQPKKDYNLKNQFLRYRKHILNGYGIQKKPGYLRNGRTVFDPRQRQMIFPLTSVSIPALGPSQTPVQWVPGSFPWGTALPGREADHSTSSSAEVENE
jgi:hypothetical protein